MTATTDQQQLETALENALKRNTEVETENSKLRGEREYYREQTHWLRPLAMVVLGEEPSTNNRELREQIAGWFQALMITTPQGAMQPVLEEIVNLLTPTTEEEPSAEEEPQQASNGEKSPEELC